MPKNKKNVGGRPKIKIDFEKVDKLCAMQCTAEEIANWFGCSVDTLDRRLREKFNKGFAEYFNQKRVVGKISLRRTQFKLAEKNPAMAIFLGKQYLGQLDKQEIDHTTGGDKIPGVIIMPDNGRGGDNEKDK